MNRSLRLTLRWFVGAVTAFGVLAAIPALSVAATPHTAQPSTTPPWEPDPDSVGALTFYNASGTAITSGSTTTSPLAAYVQGSNTIRSGDTRATLYGFLPVSGAAPGTWSGEALTSSTVYPNADAPTTALKGPLPLVTGSDTDEDLATLALDFPNTDTTDDGYAGMYQLRLYTSGPDESQTTTYDSADIMISGSTWTVVYSEVHTTTALAISPTGTESYGTAEKLTATVTPATAPGKVNFYDGSKLLGDATVSAGTAKLTTTTIPSGANALTAVYEPTSGSLFGSSTSHAVSLHVEAAKTTTTLKANLTKTTKGKKVTFTATVTPANGGHVTFELGAKKLGTVPVTKGVATFATTSLPVGKDGIKADFVSTVPAEYDASSSKVLDVTVQS